MHKYLPHTKKDIDDMLKVIGASSLDDLFNIIPSTLIMENEYQIPSSLSDVETNKLMNYLANKNKQLKIFRGYGAYDTYTPSVVKSLISRQEFLTSYTPYQPEVSQGTLQYIFEYQSMICELTGMDAANSSMYDGPTATAEAMFMALGSSSSKKIVYSKTIHPRTIEIFKTYGLYRDVEFVALEEKNGLTDFDNLDILLENSAGLILQNPNKYGIVENLNNISEHTNKHKSLFILNTDVRSLSLFKTPGELGADIACGDLQPLGINLSWGGPYIGFLATKTRLLRKMPGRICGLTKDVDGKRAFVLTLQAREQHIRRAKANSNICSNQSLMALSSLIYLTWLGKEGFIKLGHYLVDSANYLKNELIKTGLFKPFSSETNFGEFTLYSSLDSEKLDEYLIDNSYLGPVYLEDGKFLFSVSENMNKDDIDTFVRIVGDFK